MPKLRKSDTQKQDDYLLGIIAKYEKIYRVKHEILAISIGMSRRTFYLRLKSPSKFTLSEIRKMAERLCIPADEIIPVIKASELQ